MGVKFICFNQDKVIYIEKAMVVFKVATAGAIPSFGITSISDGHRANSRTHGNFGSTASMKPTAAAFS